MAYSTLLGELSYRLTLDKSSFDRGMADAQVKVKGFKQGTDESDLSIKKLAKDSSILGGSLATLGGTAMVAGTAIGGPLGEGLQSAGMGVAFVGSGVATVTPALRILALSIDETVIPALMRLNAFLGPTGWIVIGIGAAAAAIGTLMYMQDRAKKPMDEYGVSAETTKKKIDDLNESLAEQKRIQDELAGIPETVAELSHRKQGLLYRLLDARTRFENLKETGTPYEVGEALWEVEGIMMELEKVSSKLKETTNRYTYGIPPERAAINQTIGFQQSGLIADQRRGLQVTPGAGVIPQGEMYNPQWQFNSTRPLVININGTVTDRSFRLDLKDQTSAQGYTW